MENVLFQNALKKKLKTQVKDPDKRIMLVAEKGTMGVGSQGCLELTMWRCGQESNQAPLYRLLTRLQ